MAAKYDRFAKYQEMGAYHWRECDRGSNIYNPPLVARYKLVLDRIPAGRVLDVGAGDGYLSGQLAERCAEVMGLEYEPDGVDLAGRMLAGRPNVSVRQGDAYNIPFESGGFDGVVMADVIEHLHEPGRAVLEMARVVKPDGVVLVTTPHWREDRPIEANHVTEYTAEQLADLLAPGFGDVRMVFSWPRMWSDFYRTRAGWRLLRLAGRMGFNPFVRESETADGFGQILAICRQPRGVAA